MKEFIEQFREAVNTAKILAPKNDIIAAMLPIFETELDMLESAQPTKPEPDHE